MTYKYYVCSQCGEFFQRIELENGYIHPCTKCNSPKLIEIPIDYRQHKRMMRKGTWDDFVKKQSNRIREPRIISEGLLKTILLNIWKEKDKTNLQKKKNY